MTEERNYFEVLNDIDVSEHIEKKGKFSYLSWPWAVEQFGKYHPTHRIEVLLHPETGDFFWPLADETGFVWVKVTVFIDNVAVTRGEPYPVLNHNNKPIESPNAFDVNTAIKRAKVKAMAEHGLGLYIYAGEDLPTNMQEPSDATIKALDAAAKKGHEVFAAAWRKINKAERDLCSKEQIESWKAACSPNGEGG